MKLIVDTNILFSGMLNQKSRIGKVLLSHHKHFQLFACSYLKEELKSHLPKLLKISGKTLAELNETEELLTKNIKFINEYFIPKESIIASEVLVSDIDPGDTLHVALTMFLKGKLWTGDKKLVSGLTRKGFLDCITTNELLKLISEIEA